MCIVYPFRYVVWSYSLMCNLCFQAYECCTPNFRWTILWSISFVIISHFQWKLPTITYKMHICNFLCFIFITAAYCCAPQFLYFRPECTKETTEHRRYCSILIIWYITSVDRMLISFDLFIFLSVEFHGRTKISIRATRTWRSNATRNWKRFQWSKYQHFTIRMQIW